MKSFVPVILLCIFIASCAGSNKTNNSAAHVDTRKKAVCGNLHVEMDKAHIDWYAENESILQSSEKVLVLPKKYRIYSNDSAQAAGFFRSIASGENVKTAIPLPEPAGCQLFSVKNQAEDKRKMIPGAVMATGEAKGQGLTLSYYRGDMTAHINWFDLEYEMITVPIKGVKYYIIYEKMPPPVNNKKNENTEVAKPEIIEFKYDK